MVSKLLTWLEDGWREKDSGIWEVRGPAAAFHPLEGDGLGRLRSRRPAARRARPRGPGGALASRCGMRSTTQVLANGWSERKQAFAQSYGTDELDAAVLQMPLVGFLPADRPADRLDG